MQNLDAEKYLNSVSSPNISLEKEKELFLIIKGENSTQKQIDNATEIICRSHIRFVSQMASYYCSRCRVEMQDMISVGVIGMMKAIERFDISKNFKFTTYCGWWIKLEMIRHIQESCTVKIPQSIHDSLIKIQTAMQEAESELSREEIKDKLEISESKMQKIDGAKISIVSLQKKCENNDGLSFLEDMIPDDSMNPYESYEKEDLLSFLKEILSDLDEKTLEIVLSKYSEKKVRLQDLANKYGVSAERIRQIRVNTVKKIKEKISEIFVKTA